MTGSGDGNGKQVKRERLEPETDEERQARLGQLFSSLSQSKSKKVNAPPSGLSGIMDVGEHKTFAVPTSDVLDRVKAFLPDFEASNAELLARAQVDKDGVNIENVENDERVIAMDLGLGVFDVNGQPRPDMGPEIELDGTRRPDHSDDSDEEDSDTAAGGAGISPDQRRDQGSDSDSDSTTDSSDDTSDNDDDSGSDDETMDSS